MTAAASARATPAATLSLRINACVSSLKNVLTISGRHSFHWLMFLTTAVAYTDAELQEPPSQAMTGM